MLLCMLVPLISVVVAVCVIWYCRQQVKRNIRLSANANSGDDVPYETPRDSKSFVYKYTDSRAYGVQGNQSESRSITIGDGSKEHSISDHTYETVRDSQMQSTTSAAYVSQADTHVAEKINDPDQLAVAIFYFGFHAWTV